MRREPGPARMTLELLGGEGVSAMEWERKFRVGAVVAIVSAMVALTIAGCASSDQGDDESRANKLEQKNEQLQQENAQLESEVERLEKEIESLRSDVADARAEASAEQATAEETQAETEDPASGPEESGGELQVVDPEELEGESVPDLLPDDFPLPSGGTVQNIYEDDSSVTMTILLDSTFDTAVAFYDEQLPPQGWEESDRTEGEVEGSKGVDISFDKGTFIPEGSPQDPNYEQVKEDLTLSIYELAPSGVAVDIRWFDYELADQQRNAEEDGSSGDQTT